MFIFVSPHKLSIKKYYLLILKIRKLRHRKTKQLVSYHSAKKYYSWGLNPGSLRSVSCNFFPNILRVNRYHFLFLLVLQVGTSSPEARSPTAGRARLQLPFMPHATREWNHGDPSRESQRHCECAQPWTVQTFVTGSPLPGLTGESSSIGKQVSGPCHPQP